MKIYLVLMLSIVCMAFSKHSAAQQTFRLNTHQQQLFKHQLQSNILAENRVIQVYLPESYYLTDETFRYPVIYLLDGEFLFDPLKGVVQHLTASGMMPDSVVVGIQNAIQAPEKITDLLSERRINVLPKLYQGDETAGWGAYEADKHLAFLATELLPFVEKNYRVNHFKTLVGVSPTATFAIHALIEKTSLFDAVIALTHWPLSLTNEQNHSVSERLTEALKNSRSTKKYLYLSQIDFDKSDVAITKSDYQQLQQLLTQLNQNNLAVKTEIHSGYAYGTTLNAFISAMAFIYPKDRWEIKYRDFRHKEKGQSLKRLQDYYDKLSNHYGFEILPKLRKWWATGDDLFALATRTKDTEQVIKYALELYPNSADAHALMAAYLTKHNQLTQALQFQRMAVKLASINQNVRLDAFVQVEKRLASRLAEK